MSKYCENSGLTNNHTKIIDLSNEQVLNEMTQHLVHTLKERGQIIDQTDV